ncbi:hypothetical protein KDL29_08595 [bacterium]|nr:hypothetical protein [bacterium]UNM07442.1 MAG: hypothetical protein H7A35_11270 [Planctomycetales bacterium]
MIAGVLKTAWLKLRSRLLAVQRTRGPAGTLLSLAMAALVAYSIYFTLFLAVIYPNYWPLRTLHVPLSSVRSSWPPDPNLNQAIPGYCPVGYIPYNGNPNGTGSYGHLYYSNHMSWQENLDYIDRQLAHRSWKPFKSSLRHRSQSAYWIQRDGKTRVYLSGITSGNRQVCCLEVVGNP